MCACQPLRQEICANVFIKTMMRNMLIEPPGLSKRINKQRSSSNVLTSRLSLLYVTRSHAHNFSQRYKTWACQILHTYHRIFTRWYNTFTPDYTAAAIHQKKKRGPDDWFGRLSRKVTRRQSIKKSTPIDWLSISMSTCNIFRRPAYFLRNAPGDRRI